MHVVTVNLRSWGIPRIEDRHDSLLQLLEGIALKFHTIINQKLLVSKSDFSHIRRSKLDFLRYIVFLLVIQDYLIEIIAVKPVSHSPSLQQATIAVP